MTTTNERDLQVRASGIHAGGQTVLFAGATGAGKTTIARLWEGRPDVRILSDDQARIHVDARSRGQNGDPISVSGTPLAALFFLQQSTHNQAVPISAAAAAAELADRALAIDDEPVDNTAALSTAERVTARVPCFRLWFRDDAGAVEAVREVLA